MYTSLFKQISQDNQWLLLWPECSCIGIGIGLLILGCILGSHKQKHIFNISLYAQIILLISFLFTLRYSHSWATSYNFSKLIMHSALGQVMRLFFMIASLLVTYLGKLYFRNKELPKGEFCFLTLIITSSFMLLVQSQHFLMLFIALETVTIGFYALVSYCRIYPLSLEGGLKYLILGSLSSAILLLGIVFLYGLAGNSLLPGYTSNGMCFEPLGRFLEMNSHNYLVQISAACVLCGIAFKIGVFPFHIWVPDVYQGAPMPVTAFLGVASKSAGVVVLLNLLMGPFSCMSGTISAILSCIGLVTILVGNITAATQRNIKRLMGLSGVAHAGYILVGLVACFYVNWAPGAIIFYLFAYLLGSFLVFGVMAHIAQDQDALHIMDDYRLLYKKSPFLSYMLVIGLGSLAGVPPLVGFIAKLFLFIALLKTGLYVLLVGIIIGVVVSMYYYFTWLKEVFFGTRTFNIPKLYVPIADKIPLIILAFLIILLGFVQAPVTSFIFNP